MAFNKYRPVALIIPCAWRSCSIGTFNARPTPAEHCVQVGIHRGAECRYNGQRSLT